MAESDFKDLEELGISSNVDELTETFTLAANHLNKLASELDNNTLLKLYAHYKQGLEGPCNTPKPSWYDIKAKSKWEAWNSLKDMPQSEAMARYIDLIKQIDPTYDVAKKTEKDNWVAVSTLNHSEEDIVAECDKTIYDYIKEGNTVKVEEMLDSFEDVNALDTEGLGLIHWAVDRGYDDIVRLLLKRGADVNLKDVDGQTALHYASGCGYFDCCETLLKNGADLNLGDADGLNALAVAADDTIKDLFLRYL